MTQETLWLAKSSKLTEIQIQFIFFLINLGPTYHQFQLQNDSNNDMFQISFRLLLIQVG